jgi:hypothetical protein
LCGRMHAAAQERLQSFPRYGAQRLYTVEAVIQGAGADEGGSHGRSDRTKNLRASEQTGPGADPLIRPSPTSGCSGHPRLASIIWITGSTARKLQERHSTKLASLPRVHSAQVISSKIGLLPLAPFPPLRVHLRLRGVSIRSFVTPDRITHTGRIR